MAEQNEFLGSMGHELRNPLSNIIAQVEALLEGVYGPLESGQKSAMTAIQESTRQMLQLIADLVDLGRIEAGAAPLVQTECLVHEKCAESVAAVAGLAQSRSIQTSFEVRPPELRVLADARRLQQTMTELLCAALLAVNSGCRLRLCVAHEGGTLKLRAAGAALPCAPRPAQAGTEEGVMTQLLGRLGKIRPIGLALLQQVVRQHGGCLSAHETSGQEIEISVSLPMRAVTGQALPLQEARPAESPASAPAPAAGVPRAPVILIADDQPALIAVTRNYFEGLGFEVITARDGGEAVQKAATLKPDLILMDVRMPVVDGLSAIQQIRASEDPETREIAIVSLSGHVSATDKEKCLAAGASAYLNKPFGIRDLDRVIAEHLRRPGK